MTNEEDRQKERSDQNRKGNRLKAFWRSLFAFNELSTRSKIGLFTIFCITLPPFVWFGLTVLSIIFSGKEPAALVANEISGSSQSNDSALIWNHLDPIINLKVNRRLVAVYLDPSTAATSVVPSGERRWYLHATPLPEKAFACEVRRNYGSAISLTIGLYSAHATYDGTFTKLYYMEIMHPSLDEWTGFVMLRLRFDQRPVMTAAYNRDGILIFDIGSSTIASARIRRYMTAELLPDSRHGASGRTQRLLRPAMIDHRFSLEKSTQAIRALKACAAHPTSVIRDSLWHAIS